MKVSCESQSAENLKDSTLLANRFDFSISQRGLRLKNRKTAGLEKRIWNIACCATEKKTNFNTKNNHVEKFHNAENYERGNLLGFLSIQFVAKYL